MARIAGIDLPRENVWRSDLLISMVSAGRAQQKICAKANVNPDIRVRELTDDEVKRLSACHR